MKRKALYSRTTRARRGAPPGFAGGGRPGDPPPAWQDDFDQGPSLFAIAWNWTRGFYARHERWFLAAASLLISLTAISAWFFLHPPPRALTQTDIDGAVRYTLANSPRPPADSARAAAIIAPSVVQVEGFLSPEHAAALAKAEAKAHPGGKTDKPAKTGPNPELPAPGAPGATTPGVKDDDPDTIGSGVVIDDRGRVLTSLHVISSTDRWVVVFADGSKSDADFVGSQPENDLAVLQPRVLPDDLKPATLASTAGLYPGDEVVATGFPFGIGPSVSSGVVSGLKREFDDPESNRPKLTNLIQFDAAVNPGNSGGPLVNRDGEVVGIVAAIVNPSGARTFAGIGFAVPIENAARALGENPL